MVAVDLSDGKILQRRITGLRGILLLLAPLYAVLVLLTAWYWSGVQLDSYLTDRRQQAEALAARAAAPLERHLEDIQLDAAALAAQPEIVDALAALNLFRRHDGGQTVDHVTCDAGQNAAVTELLQNTVSSNRAHAAALLDSFGDCQATSRDGASRHLFGPRSIAGAASKSSLNVVRDGKARPLGLAVTVPSRDAQGRVFGAVSFYLDRSRLNALLPEGGLSSTVSLVFEGGDLRPAQPWTMAAKHGDVSLMKIAMRGAPGHDVVVSPDGWDIRAQHRLCNLAAVHASVAVDPIGYRLGQFALVLMLAVGLPALGLMIVQLARRAARLQGLPTA